MMAILDNVSELTAGGIFVVLVLKLVFDFLNAREAKKRRPGETTEFFTKSKSHDCLTAKQAEAMSTQTHEIHEALLAAPPRPSLFTDVSVMKTSMQATEQKQRETVAVLEEIRELIRGQTEALEKAECGGCSFAADQKKI